MARMVEGLLLHQQQQQPIRQRTASIASRSVIGITNGNRPNEVKKSICNRYNKKFQLD